MINLYSGSEPIINPWMLYLADFLDGLKTALLIIGGVLAILSVVGILIYFMLNEFNDVKELLKKIKISVIGSLFTILLAIVVPSKTTIYSMAIFEALTPDTVQIIFEETGNTASDILNEGVGAVEDILDYVVEKVNEIRRGDSNG